MLRFSKGAFLTRIPRRSARLHNDHLDFFKSVEGEHPNIAYFKAQIYEMLKPACHPDNDPEFVGPAMNWMCVKAKEICITRIISAYPLVEPILNVVQSQYSNIEEVNAQKARQLVGVALRSVRVAGQVSSQTLLDSNLLDIDWVDGWEAQVSNKGTASALEEWLSSHRGEQKQIAEVVGEICKRQDEIDPNDPYAEEKAALYDDWKAIFGVAVPH